MTRWHVGALGIGLAAAVLLASCQGDDPANDVLAAAPTSPASESSAAPSGDGQSDEWAAEEFSGWLFADQTSVVFTRWIETEPGALTGSFRVAFLGDGESVSVWDGSLVGSRTGEELALTVEGIAALNETVTGTLADDAVTLLLPQPDGRIRPLELLPASVADFNAAVDALAARGGSARDDRERAEAEQEAREQLAAAKQSVVRHIDLANARDMEASVLDAESILGRDVEQAIAELEVVIDGEQGDFYADEVGFALDAVGFALDSVGFEVDAARTYGRDRALSSARNLRDAVGALTETADWTEAILGNPDPDVPSLAAEGRAKASAVEASVDELDADLITLGNRATERWAYAADIAAEAGATVRGRTGYGRDRQ